jgi:hypothetical protein
MHVRDELRRILHPLRVYGQVREALYYIDRLDWVVQPATVEQPAPTKADGRPVWDLVIEDMKARDHLGRSRYGRPLQAGNGRDALVDAYQEALDLAVYLRQAIEERP